MDLKLIRGDHESFDEELGGTIANKTVTFHLSESETTLARAAFGGLAG